LTDREHPRAERLIAGRYKLIEPIREDAQRQIWRGRDERLHRLVAVSIIRKDAGSQAPAAPGKPEAIGAIGDHDNILPIYDIGEEEGFYFLVCALFARGTLEDAVRKRAERRKPLNEVELTRLGRQIARALSHLHDRQLVHCDINPANIWLDERGEAHLGDLESTARMGGAAPPLAHPVRTEAFTAPELRSAATATPTADLYSLGAVLYFAATGQAPPLDGGRSARSALAEARPDLRLSLRATICDLLDPDPERRPREMGDLIEKVLRPVKDARIDELPFPLALALWRERAETDPERKSKLLLLGFFEALAILRVTILAAPLLNRKGPPESGQERWAHPANARSEGRGEGSFGVWVELGERLASGWQRYLREAVEDPRALRERFCMKGLDRLQRLMSEELTKLLLHARDLRNNWQGHGGIPASGVWQQRLGELHEIREEALHALGGVFDSWLLVLPRAPEYDELGEEPDTWVHRKALTLIGPNPTFPLCQLRVRKPLPDKRLHLIEEGADLALALPPLVRLHPADPSEGRVVFFFYNRQDRGGARYISYQGDDDGELHFDDAATGPLLPALERATAALCASADTEQRASTSDAVLARAPAAQ